MKKVMTAENLLDSLLLICQEIKKSPTERKKCTKRFKRAFNEGRLHFEWSWRNALWCYNVCVAELIQGRYHWTGWEARSNANKTLSTHKLNFPRWDGSACKLLVIAEQGLGDEILFASCFGELLKQCPNATIECDPRLEPIFQRSFDAKFISRWNAFGDPKSIKSYPVGSYDAFVPAGDLPKIYRHSREDFPGTPYLKATRRNLFRDFPGPTYGLSWKGRQGSLFPHELMAWKGNWVDLQYGPHPTPDKVMATDWNEITNNIDLVFDLVASTEAVVCVPNTLAHIAGSIGTTAHVVRPNAIYPGDDLDDPNFHNRINPTFGLFDGGIPWYRSVKTYRNLADFRGKYVFGKRQASAC